MFKNRRFISLYYSSIGFLEILILIWGTILYVFFKKKTLKKNNILRYFTGKSVYPFSSARGALSACMDFANIGSDDEVILSSFTCLAVPTAIVNLGAKPIYADINLNTLNTDINDIVDLINPRVKAVILQHTFGNSADIKSLVKILKNKKILLIEDCALSIGTKIDDKLLGNFGDASIFSMELSKTITTGWGGVLVVNKSYFKNINLKYNNYYDNNLFEVFRDVFQTVISAINNMPKFYFIGKYISYGFFKLNFFRYSTTENEINGLPSDNFISKLSFPFIYLANYQWRRLDEISNKCSKNHSIIQSKLRANGYSILNPSNEKNKIKPISSRIAFLVKDRGLIMDFFFSRGVELGKWFDGPLTPAPNSDSFNYVKKNYKNSNIISKHIVNIPCHFRLSNGDINLICNLIDEFSLKNPLQNLFN
jgi:dTDP-4-amino-4,6-dideoxygalactose transaminase